ncbi:MAG TPA: hypothetical protein VFE23_22470 [Usitatibacter sp.]|jgi:hypothetical protein|nr:hypothetical protein [Usitatibacter sp.]
MKWTKLGLVFCPDRNFPWMQTHAAGPFAEPIEGDRFRIYFGCRDAQQRTHIGTVELDLTRPDKVLDLSPEPVVGPGEPGLFDDSGTSMGCLVRYGDTRYLYYLGWNLGVTVPWRNTIGVAAARDGEKGFRKLSRAPLLDRSEEDPFSISYPWVLEDGGRWRMWYGSNLSWGEKPESMAHVIKEANGAGPLHWSRSGDISIAAKSAAEHAISKPCVLKENGLYRMWYSHRGDTYRIGYAESRDGTHWTRRDEDVGIDVSASGWDSESIQYAHVFRHRGRLYMLYNGNHYGKTGVGLALCESE